MDNPFTEDPAVTRAKAILDAGIRQSLENSLRVQIPRLSQGPIGVKIASPYTGNIIEIGQICQTPKGFFLPKIKAVGGGSHRIVKGSTTSHIPSDAAVDLLDQWLDREVQRGRMSEERRWDIREPLVETLRKGFSVEDAVATRTQHS